MLAARLRRVALTTLCRGGGALAAATRATAQQQQQQSPVGLLAPFLLPLPHTGSAPTPAWFLGARFASSRGGPPASGPGGAGDHAPHAPPPPTKADPAVAADPPGAPPSPSSPAPTTLSGPNRLRTAIADIFATAGPSSSPALMAGGGATPHEVADALRARGFRLASGGEWPANRRTILYALNRMVEAGDLCRAACPLDPARVCFAPTQRAADHAAAREPPAAAALRAAVAGLFVGPQPALLTATAAEVFAVLSARGHPFGGDDHANKVRKALAALCGGGGGGEGGGGGGGDRGGGGGPLLRRADVPGRGPLKVYAATQAAADAEALRRASG